MYVAFWKFLHYVKVLIYQIDSTDNTMSLNSTPFVKLFGAITFFPLMFIKEECYRN